MAITSVKIHPAIGIARVGNSPDDFFIGPERLWDPPDPPGGFKDASCRVKRQAARFRLFAYHDDGAVTELGAADADITWTVHLANRKAAERTPTAPAADVTIDPGPRTLDGPNQRNEFDDGTVSFPGTSTVTVPLGEIRTDDDGRLLVLGGFGTSASPGGETISSFLVNPGWHDDVADGPVTAQVTMHAGGQVLTAAGSWVVVGPPSFAPQIENVITLQDRLEQMAVEQGWLAPPAQVSYTEHVYPILQRARTTRWVVDVFGAHAWPDPVYDTSVRQAVFNRLEDPAGGGSNMPRLQMATLTPTQYAVMERWRDGDFVQDWAGPPAPAAAVSPGDLDRAALTNAVGAAFYPGIEAGGLSNSYAPQAPVVVPANYLGASDPLRLDHSALSAGDLSRYMAVPWQADFYSCGTEWWPVPRPNDVVPQDAGGSLAWDRDIGGWEGMVAEWHTLGYVVRQGNAYVEVDRCDTTFVTLVTPHLDFQDVPQGPMGAPRKAALAISFEVRSTGAPVTLSLGQNGSPAHPRVEVLSPQSVTVGPTAGNQVVTAQLQVTYQTGPVGESITDAVTVIQDGTSRSWTITITGNTVTRKVAAAALVLDRSGSMTEDRGDGQSKYVSLVQAASIFVDVALEGDRIGIVRYNHDAQALAPITTLGPANDPFDTARQTLKDTIAGGDLAPSGATSIGDGIFEGRQILDAAAGGHDVAALVVLTDGKENQPRAISDVAAQIDDRTFAVGLGTPQNTSAPALQTLSGNTGGYLLVTGPIAAGNRFVLQKYFLQILAGVSNAEVVLDPDGVLGPGQDVRVPFHLTEADTAVDVILLTDEPRVIDFRIQTPAGHIVEPWWAVADTMSTWVLSRGVAYYRFVLPLELFTARYSHAGTWHALLRVGRPRVEPPDDRDRPDRDQPVPPGRGVDPARRLPPRTGPEFAAVTAASGRATPPDSPPAGLAGSQAASLGVGPAQQQRRIAYSLLVHAYSDLSLRAAVVQSGYEPGADVTLSATVATAGVPAAAGATVWAEVVRPDGTGTHLPMDEVDQGRFSGTFTAAAAGVHRCRVRASGRSPAGYPYQREQTLTAAVWAGGDRDARSETADGPLVAYLRERDERLCRLLHCLLGERGVLTRELQERLRRQGFDVEALQRCLAEYCEARTRGDEELDALG